jgi:four helix bundle protein
MDKPHKKLDVWNVAIELVRELYRVTESFPAREIYSLSSQLRRTTISIPSNIAEGAARHTKKEFVNYLHMAQGSLSEVDTQIEIAKRLGYVSETTWAKLDAQMERIDKMLSGLIRQQSPSA